MLKLLKTMDTFVLHNFRIGLQAYKLTGTSFLDCNLILALIITLFLLFNRRSLHMGLIVAHFMENDLYLQALRPIPVCLCTR